MERKQFLRSGFIAALGSTALIPLAQACKKTDDLDSTESGNNAGSCTVSPTETAGPFPTKQPLSLVSSDIRSDRTGVPMQIRITVNNRNASCAALSGAIVDIWHCDRDGYYSEYGGTGMQTANFTSVHSKSLYTRGLQDTSNAGDNVFADSLASELASVSGSVAAGYTLTHIITVNA